MQKLMSLLLCAVLIAMISAYHLDRMSNATSPLSELSSFVSGEKTYTYHDPFCIWHQNAVSYSFAILIPYDGSATEDGVDAKCKCGEKFKSAMKKKGVALTDW